jgi:PASTA domain-containing protein
MLHPFPASRMRPPILTSLGVVVLALLMLALVPGSARATCASSTASGPSNFTDTPGENTAGAPDIGTVNNALDASCELRVEVLLTPLALQANQFLVVQFDLDESTGDSTTELVDVEVYIYPDGSAWLNDLVPLPTFGQYGFTVSLDQLGVTRSPSLLGVAAAGVFDPDGFPNSGDETYDDAPDLASVMHRVLIRYAQPPPPPPPPPAAAPPPAATKQAAGCKVPKIKGLTVKKAKAALKKAGCKYKLKGKGRVSSVSPKAGTRTSATVQVKARKKKPKKSARRSDLARAVQLR